jgi:hypothetical protein
VENFRDRENGWFYPAVAACFPTANTDVTRWQTQKLVFLCPISL